MAEPTKEDFGFWIPVVGTATIVAAICDIFLGGSWLLGLFWRAFKWGAGME